MVRRVMVNTDRRLRSAGVHFWVLGTFLVIVAAFGGGSRADIQSLAILRPVSVLYCGFALWTLPRQTAHEYRVLLGFAAAVVLLVLLHLVPLPPAIWHMLPGRGVIAEVDAVAQLGSVWRPIAMVPQGAWNAFYSLFAPAAVLLLGIQLRPEERMMLVPLLLGVGAVSGFLGLMQAIGPSDGPLYFYQITSNGSAVGLFANRNHQAILLAMMFPLLAVYASSGIRSIEQLRRKTWIACAIGATMIPLILVTGSRAGLLVAILGLACAAFLYRKPVMNQAAKRKVVRFDPRYAIAAFAILCMVALTVIMSRAATFERLLAADQAEELRFRIWGPIARMAWTYFPLGSGAGSFVEVYQIHEPYELLNPTYLNHAHNDFLEIYLTLGLPGLLLLAAAFFALVRVGLRLTGPAARSQDTMLQRLGLALISIVAVGSVGDYPLRTPLLACIFVVAVLWLCTPIVTGRRQRQEL